MLVYKKVGLIIKYVLLNCILISNLEIMNKLIILITAFIFSISISQKITAQEITSNKNSTALIIIDIQNFYFPEGSLPLFEPEKAAEKAAKILVTFRDNKITVIHVRHNANSGSEIHELVAPVEGEKIISKDKANSFVGTDLLDYLKENKIKNLVICGMQTHMCLEAATRAASDYGFNCTVIEDACTTRDLKFGETIVSAKEVHSSTLSTLKGTYAEIKTAEEFVKSFK
jgi:nicotinamidase-related amidase